VEVQLYLDEAEIRGMWDARGDLASVCQAGSPLGERVGHRMAARVHERVKLVFLQELLLQHGAVRLNMHQNLPHINVADVSPGIASLR
jgi:hypothetical protein